MRETARQGIMKILRDSITSLIRRGYTTTQVPEVNLYFPGDPIPTDEELYEDAKPEWFWRLSGDTPSPRGFLHLTKAGILANEAILKAAWEAAIADDLARPLRRDVREWEEAQKRKNKTHPWHNKDWNTIFANRPAPTWEELKAELFEETETVEKAIQKKKKSLLKQIQALEEVAKQNGLTV